ncbi:MAG: lysophospholipid acyltransferase family protein [Ignavibacteriaceae bacterium]|nr:lysophospholipid acyltransferase family protein [Ignavibacteriaceae bacterium]
MQLKSIKKNMLRFIGQVMLNRSINILCKTLRIEEINKEAIEQLERANKNYVFAFWHGTMLLPWYVNRNKNFVGLTSKSKDGNLLAKLLKSWKYNVVRGSSSTGGEVALGIMIDYARGQMSVAVTPDGPRGPAMKLKAGAVITAKKSGVPLVLAGVGYKNKKHLNSWDKFQIPKPFSTVRIIYSDPIYVERTLTYENTSELIKLCDDKLNELQNKASVFV